MTTTALQAMGLRPDATVDEVKTRWRELSLIHHPDRGGDAETFDMVRKTYLLALKEAEAPKVCETCLGSGKTVVRHGFSAVAMVCQDCQGLGHR